MYPSEQLSPSSIVYFITAWLKNTWRRSVVVSMLALINLVGPVSTWMGDRLRAGKPSRYVTSHLGQLSLLTLPGVGKLSTGLSGWG